MENHTARIATKLLNGLAISLSLLPILVFATPIDSSIILAQSNISEQLKKQNILTSDSIVVIYPDIAEPLRSVFTKIIEGIEEQSKIKVKSIPITDKQDITELYNQLKRTGTKVVIALGKNGLKIASNFEKDIAVVVGGAFFSPEPENSKLLGISLTPDPALLFGRLKEISPSTKKVFVVYDPKNTEWLLKFARTAAKAQGIELITYEARDLASAARQYETIFANADGKTDAIWLPKDETTVDESTILPIVLRESWNRNVPFFSSTFIHVKKGALFSLTPNNLELGHNLANSAMAVLAGDASKKGVMPLRDVQGALNVRTAQHIGLNIGTQPTRNFNIIFPEN
jgi:putative ABC transport system substrate-binding protein